MGVELCRMLSILPDWMLTAVFAVWLGNVGQLLQARSTVTGELCASGAGQGRSQSPMAGGIRP